MSDEMAAFLAANVDEAGNIPAEVMDRALSGDFDLEDLPSKQAEPEEKPVEAEEKEEKPVVLTKDGKHTIPFEQYDEYRRTAEEMTAKVAELEGKAAEWETTVKSLEEKIAAAETVQDKAGEQAGVDFANLTDEEIESLSSDWPEVYKMYKQYQAQQSIIDDLRSKVDSINSNLTEITETKKATEAQSAAEQAWNAHHKAITDAHKDYDSLVDSGKLEAWVKTQPAFIQNVFESGSTKDVIDMVAMFKAANPGKKVDVKDAIAKAEEAASLPNSLSDIPAIGDSYLDETEKLTRMDASDRLDYLASLPESRRQEVLSRFL